MRSGEKKVTHQIHPVDFVVFNRICEPDVAIIRYELQGKNFILKIAANKERREGNEECRAVQRLY